MEDGDEGAAAAEAAAEAALGLDPQEFVDEVHAIAADISADAFEHCLQAAAAPGVLGAARAAEKATDLQRGLNAIHNVVRGRLDKRIDNFAKFCLGYCFDIPEGFVAAEDVCKFDIVETSALSGECRNCNTISHTDLENYQSDNSCAKESHKDGTLDSDLDLELESLRRKLESANKESENLEREMLSLEKQTAYKRKLDSSVSEIKKVLEDKSVQETFEGLVKAIPVLQQKTINLNKKTTEMTCLLGNKRLTLDKSSTARAEGIQEVGGVLQNI